MNKELSKEELQEAKSEILAYDKPEVYVNKNFLLSLISTIESQAKELEQAQKRIEELEKQRWEETKRHVDEEWNLEERAEQEEKLYFQCAQENEQLRKELEEAKDGSWKAINRLYSQFISHIQGKENPE